MVARDSICRCSLQLSRAQHLLKNYFEELHTWDGIVHSNFKSACIARGLLDSNEQWDRSLTGAALWQGGFQLCELFVCILLHCQPADALQLWRNHSANLSDDCRIGCKQYIRLMIHQRNKYGFI